MAKLRRNVIEGQLEERVHRGRRLLYGDAGLEPRKRPQNHLPRIGAAIRGAIEGGGNKNVFVAEDGHFELRRKDPHYESGPTIERDGAPRKIAITGEAGTPQPVGDKRDARAVRPVFLAREIATEERLNPEGRQECRFDERALQTDGIPFGEIAIGSAGDKRGYGLKRSLRFLPVHVIRTEHKLIRFERGFIAKANQAFVVGIGQAAEKNTIDHAEDCCRGSDPQGEGEYRYKCKSRALPQSTKGKAQVLQQSIQKWNAALFAVQLFGLFDAAEFPPRGITRVRRTHASANVFLGEHLQMCLKLGLEVTVKFPFAKQATQTHAENVKPLHVRLLPYHREGVP